MISHLNKKNSPKIVDISNKKKSKRLAIAEGIINFSESTFKKIKSLKTKKGNIENLAIIAGVLGAKKTSELIPLCHNIEIEDIDINIETMNKLKSLKIIASVKSEGKTGVEMEALTAVQISLLTIYDMCKSIDKGMVISEIKLELKKGGASGEWKRSK